MFHMKKAPNEVDHAIGQRIKARRQYLGYNQQTLAEQIGVSYQQVQKYENGSDRVGASRLFAIAKALEVDISYFFEEYTDAPPDDDAMQRFGREHVAVERAAKDPETRRLLKIFMTIENPELRSKLIDMAELFAQTRLPGKRE
jgi:transcriptional regulator with XRE-family HTH domain